MSPIRLEMVTPPPSAVEAELAALTANASQRDLATIAGLTNHKRINDGISAVTSGQRDGYLDAFSAAKVLRWARSYAPLGIEIRKYLDGDNAHELSAVDSLRAEISADAEMIGHINAALSDDKLTRTERAKLALELRKSVDRQTKAIRALERA